jgi:hypothetical protein
MSTPKSSKEQSFADQIAGTISAAEHALITPASRQYRDLLNELATGLSTQGVGAHISRSADPRRLGLYLHPRYRPARGSLMLSFFLDGEEIVAAGAVPKRLGDVQELKQFLLNFVTIPAFLESMETLRAMEKESVEARLGVSADRAFAVGDVIVAVAAKDQEHFAQAEVGTETTIEVSRVSFPGNAAWAKDRRYQVLDSAGIVARIGRIVPKGTKLSITGVKIQTSLVAPVGAGEDDF